MVQGGYGLDQPDGVCRRERANIRRHDRAVFDDPSGGIGWARYLVRYYESKPEGHAVPGLRSASRTRVSRKKRSTRSRGRSNPKE